MELILHHQDYCNKIAGYIDIRARFVNAIALIWNDHVFNNRSCLQRNFKDVSLGSKRLVGLNEQSLKDRPNHCAQIHHFDFEHGKISRNEEAKV